MKMIAVKMRNNGQQCLSQLQFDVVLDFVSGHCMSYPAMQAISKTVPCTNLQEATRLLQLTEQAMLMLSISQNPIKSFDDIAPVLEKCKIGAVCSIDELDSVATLLNVAKSATGAIMSHEGVELLKDIVRQAFDLRILQKALADCIEKGELKDSASDKLFSIRRQKRNSELRLQSRLQSFMRNSKYSQYLQDDIVTMREGRFVLPVKTEHKGSVQGLLHDQSASGATVFIEPYELVNANNELKALIAQENAEIHNILKGLSNLVAKDYQDIASTLAVCINLDTIFCKANYSLATKAALPILNDKGIVDLKNARHPCIAPTSVVPINISVGGDNTILLISGPNTGGKTVSLKIVGLVSLMASSGLFVPCDKDSVVCVFKDIFCLVGDGQSIEQSLSTFSSHIKGLVNTVQHASRQSLVLLDELGAGTDPQEGAAIALGTIKYFANLGCTTIVTSHYNSLKEHATVTAGILNASMQFDSVTLQPTYKLAMRIPGASYALTIATNLGLDKSIIDQAYKNLSADSIAFDKLLRHMQAESAKIDAQLQELDELKEQLQTSLELAKRQEQLLQQRTDDIKQNAKKLTEELVEDAKHKVQNIVEAIKEQAQNADEQALFRARAIKNKLDDITLPEQKVLYQPITTTPIKGDKVVIKTLGLVGTIKDAKPNDIFVVSVGAMTINCQKTDLAELQKPIKAPNSQNRERASSDKKDQQTNDSHDIPVELMLIGNTVAQAELDLDAFIEQCRANNQKNLRIVHGKGSGVLGRGIQQYLRHLKVVKSFRYGGYGEGDSGVTIVQLK